MAKNIQPLWDRVLLKPSQEVKSESGIYIPTSNSERGLLMTVEALGPGVSGDFEVGEKVLVHKYAGVEVLFESEKGLYTTIVTLRCQTIAEQFRNFENHRL